MKNEDYTEEVEEALDMAIEALDRDENGKENRVARIIYDFLKIKIGSKIVDNPFEFEDWYNRMIWHVQECNKLQIKYKGGEKAEPKRGKWIDNHNGTFSCSKCQSWLPKEQRNYARFCLHCGIKMESEE